ncbi:DUF6684 family protein [Natronocalculus amylovorans]|uniref:Cox cluster protein n=1 Tax=Natronocalculus amylovorans TaxID=2917812 RepID=A0AAE3FUJ7_9EURY|nr:DUF6684 family protein [Natronocalculus amylovorans]MCL9815400.1 cox cluster protein [Natronocalculus amylovorans]NUE02085.1 cox cluster protein [Halorubraceae archaeon YAN]
MATKIFDKDTILDLTVNFVPLGILAVFIGIFVFADPWGFDLRASLPMYLIMFSMVISLGILTYISGKAIAGDEKKAEVYSQGQAFLDGAEPIDPHGHGENSEETDEHESKTDPENEEH